MLILPPPPALGDASNEIGDRLGWPVLGVRRVVVEVVASLLEAGQG